MRIEIPTSLDDVKISQLIKWNEAVEMYSDKFLPFQMVSIFCNIDVNEVIKIPLNKFNDIVDTLNETLTKEVKFYDRFFLGTKQYGFIPNLDEISSAEYIDLDTYMETDILRAMMVLFRPVENTFKQMYNIKEYKGTDGFEIMLEAPASAFLGAKVFFWNLRNELVKRFPVYLNQQMTSEQKIDLQKNGDGIFQLMQLLEDIDLNTMKFTN